MEPNETASRAEAFAADFQALMDKHFGDLPEDDWEPFAMQLRERFPQVESSVAAQVTTTITGTWNGRPDTDPPDQDTPY